MMSQAARSAEVVAAGSGGSNVRGVSAAVPIRSILNVRIAAALLVEADQVERVGLERRLEQVRPDRRPARASRPRS